MSEHRGDVAKFAVERAAARELHAHRRVPPQVRQLPQRRRRLVNVRVFRRCIHTPGVTRFEVAQKPGQRHLRFIQHKVVNLGELLVLEGEQRPARHDRLARRAAAGDQLARRVPLGNHPADEHNIRPRQVLFAQLPHIHIHQALRPPRREHRRHGQQAQRRQGSPLPDEFQGVFETPKRVRELRVQQQYIHHWFKSIREPARTR